MVDPVFKAPTPPPMNEAPVQAPVSTPSEQADSVAQQSVSTSETPNASQPSLAQPKSKKQEILDRLNELKGQMIQYFWYTVAGLFLLGTFFGCSMSGPSSAPPKAPVQSGISARVIPNTDRKGGMPICGSVLQSQSCLFYVLNHSGQDRIAEDFFKQVSTDTQRPLFQLSRDNVTYAKMPIKPGYFAEIIVPALR